MSYRAWTLDGYGICVDDIDDVTVESVMRLIHMAPEFEATFTKWLYETYDMEINREEGLEFLTMDQIEEYDNESGYSGIGPILLEVISELEPIPFILCDDYDCYQFILYEPKYPWGLKYNERNLTEEDVAGIFRKYVNVLTSNPIAIDYYSVENGG